METLARLSFSLVLLLPAHNTVSIALIHLLACCPKVLPFTFGLFCGQDHVLGLSFLAVVSQVPPYSDLPGRHAGRDMMQTSVQFLGVELDL